MTVFCLISFVVLVCLVPSWLLCFVSHVSFRACHKQCNAADAPHWHAWWWQLHLFLLLKEQPVYLQHCVSAAAVLFSSGKNVPVLASHTLACVPFLSHTPLGSSSGSQLPFESLLGDLAGGREVVRTTCPVLPSLETLKVGPPRVTGVYVLDTKLTSLRSEPL